MATNISETVKRVSEFNTELRATGCISPLHESGLESIMLAKAQSRNGIGQRCARLSSGTWVVQLGLGSTNWYLGYADKDRQLDALRYADLALRVFWKYKRRGAHPPRASELNGTPEQLNRDWSFEQHLVKSLHRIEMILLQDGVISSDVARLNIALTQQGKTRSEAQLELSRKQMEDECKSDERFRALEARLQQLENKLSQLAEIVQRRLEFDNNNTHIDITS